MKRIILYSSPDGAMSVEVAFEDENIWLTQRKLSELFSVTVPTINEHLGTIFATGKNLDESESVIQISE
ncbi:MAG: hypothetical protein R2839_03410 [Thermomicrobiales bacterium]